jgi:hypothetical protein
MKWQKLYRAISSAVVFRSPVNCLRDLYSDPPGKKPTASLPSYYRCPFLLHFKNLMLSPDASQGEAKPDLGSFVCTAEFLLQLGILCRPYLRRPRKGARIAERGQVSILSSQNTILRSRI